MRSPDDDSRRNYPRDFTAATSTPIPNKDGMPTGITGVKAPAGYKQTGDIKDRMQAQGFFRPGSYDAK